MGDDQQIIISSEANFNMILRFWGTIGASQFPLFPFAGGLRPRDFPLGRAGGEPSLSTLFLFFTFWRSTFSTLFFQLFWGSTGLGRYLIFSVGTFHVECRQIHVWRPLLAWVMTIFKKTCIFVKVELRDNLGWKERWKLYRMVFSKYKTLRI